MTTTVAGHSEFTALGTLHLGSELAPVPGSFSRFDLLIGTVRVNALLWINESFPDRLVIATNGAVARKPGIDPREVFQRRTWVEDFRGSALFLSDPTIRPDNSLAIAWGQGAPRGFALPAMAQTAQYVARHLDVPSSRRLYYGSSAGGFQAMQLAARDEHSLSLVNNPQIDWTRYMEANVRSICRHSYGTADSAEVSAQFPARTHAVKAFAETGYVPPVRYLLNTASKNDVTRQMDALLRGMKSIASLSALPRIDVATYYDEKSGHMPIPKLRTLQEINAQLDGMVH